MVFEEIIRHSPRRRASPCIAEGFSPTASAVYRIYFSIPISPTAKGAYRIYFSISISKRTHALNSLLRLALRTQPHDGSHAIIQCLKHAALEA